MALSAQDLKYFYRLRKAGFVYNTSTILEAKRAGLPLSAAAALLDKESGKGQNIFGHDPTIYAGAGKVTKSKYLAYKAARKRSGNRLMQGVGPCQLTWYATQDAADRIGGCWVPRYNKRVGFKTLADLIKQYGVEKGAAHYNGTGPAATAYGRDFKAKQKHWHDYLVS